MYFILLDAIINGIVFLLSLSDCSLLVYGKATFFCILILYLATLLNSFISSNSFWLETIGFYIYSIMLFATTDSFTSFFPIGMPFISFSCLIAVARTSNTVLNACEESGHLCLVCDFRGKAFSFSPLSMMLGVALSYMIFIMLRYVPYTNFDESFYHKWMLNFVRCFFCLLK